MEKNVTVKKKQAQTDTKTTVLTALAQAVTEMLVTEEALPDRTKGIVHWGEEKNTLPYYLL